MNTQALHGIMKAEQRYQDMFTNEMSDELPVMYPHVGERLESLERLNQQGALASINDGLFSVSV